MQQLLFVTVRQDCDTGTIFGNLKLRGQGELQHGVIEVDQGVDPDKALQRPAPFKSDGFQAIFFSVQRQAPTQTESASDITRGSWPRDSVPQISEKRVQAAASLWRDVVVFSWPSGAHPYDYDLALRNLRKSVDGLSSLLITIQPRVTSIMAVCHSMGARLALLAVGPHTLQQGAEQHKFVFAAADMRQHEFRNQLVAAGASNLHRVSVLLASTQDNALKWSQRAHTHPNPLLSRSNMDGAGSRAGCCEASVCCHPEAFTTVDCSRANCCDKDRHDYVCSSPAVSACLGRLFDNMNWDTGPEIAIAQVVAEEDKNRSKRTMQVKTLVGP